ncbi:MAG: 1,4-dihydroxy-2-naphthoate octaprenyltransferase [Candidatus Margulisiibacteriota bacterium]
MKIKIWLQALRTFALPASMVSVFLGAALAYRSSLEVNWLLFPIVILGAFLFHSAMNVFNDYYDYKRGVDKKHTLGSSRVLVDNLLSPKELFTGAWILLILASLLGIYLIYLRGMPMLILIVIGSVGAFLYSGGPFAYKYHALGEPMVFLLFGPLLVLGSYLALTGSYDQNVFLISLPVGFLVSAILSGNNFRDIQHDKQANIKTIAILLGSTGAKLFYALLVLAAYTSVIILVVLNMLNIWSLVVLITLPPAFMNISVVLKDQKEKVAIIDMNTAKLHLPFGVLLILSILFGR